MHIRDPIYIQEILYRCRRETVINRKERGQKWLFVPFGTQEAIVTSIYSTSVHINVQCEDVCVQVFDDCTIMTVLMHILYNNKQRGFTALYAASQKGWKDVVELLLDSGASVDKKNVVTYRLAFTQTLRERVCVAQWISMCHHGTPQDNIGHRSIELRYIIMTLQYTVCTLPHPVSMETLHMHQREICPNWCILDPCCVHR